ncbi:MAG TPA: hypothetical protein VK815_00625 [Candidatus Acidoferrales bacterium]|jgi:hypothetical protein|nr:hypothetical protein [Candidatus Acidoferrales bacterium]
MSKFSMAKDAAEKAMSAESARTESLLREGGKLAAGIVIVLGFQLLDLKALLESSSAWAKISSCASLGVLGISLLLAVCSQQAKGYANYPRGFTLWDNLKPENVSTEAAEEALMQMLLKTREQNARLNDAKTRVLYWCRWLLFIGILSVAGSQLLDAYASGLID